MVSVNATIERTAPMPLAALETSDASALADVIFGRALQWVSIRRQCAVEQALAELRRGEPAAWHALKLGLARYAAEFLGFFDEDVKAVYVADFADSYRREPDERAPQGMVHLIVFANSKTAALKSLINVLDRALDSVMSQRIGRTGTKHSLEVQLVDGADLEHLARYAALLMSVGDAPTCIWERDPADARLEKHKC
jgi:hypothetical protein